MVEKTCPFCKEEIKDGAIKCKHCGSVLVDTSKMDNHVESKRKGTLWLPIPSLVIGIICLIAMFDESYWEFDEILGSLFIAIAGIVLGAISLSIQKVGKGMAIAGIIMSSISALILMDMLISHF